MPFMFTRSATVADAGAIAVIYNHEVHTGIATFDMIERTPAEQEQWLRNHAGAHPCIVAVEGTEADPGPITGWASLSPYRPRPAYSTSVEDSVYVHPDFQRRGVGDLLLRDLVTSSDSLGFHSIFARIAKESDTAAAGATEAASGAASIALHAKHGFELLGVEREVGRKFGRWLDVTVMQRLFSC